MVHECLGSLGSVHFVSRAAQMRQEWDVQMWVWQRCLASSSKFGCSLARSRRVMLGSRIFRVLRLRSLGSASRRAILVGQKIRCSNIASGDKRPRRWSVIQSRYRELRLSVIPERVGASGGPARSRCAAHDDKTRSKATLLVKYFEVALLDSGNLR